MQFATRANSSIDFVQRLNSAETVVRAWIPDAEGGTKVVVPAAEAAADASASASAVKKKLTALSVTLDEDEDEVQRTEMKLSTVARC